MENATFFRKSHMPYTLFSFLDSLKTLKGMLSVWWNQFKETEATLTKRNLPFLSKHCPPMVAYIGNFIKRAGYVTTVFLWGVIRWGSTMTWPPFFKMESFTCHLMKSLPFKDHERKFKMMLKNRGDHYLQKNERINTRLRLAPGTDQYCQGYGHRDNSLLQGKWVRHSHISVQVSYPITNLSSNPELSHRFLSLSPQVLENLS